MMKSCPECAHNCAQNALFCPSCGYVFTVLPQGQTTVKLSRSRMHRLPNGFGSIKKLPGRRRRPFAAYPPTQGYHDNGTAIYRKAIGYFTTYQEAYEALTDFNRSPYDAENKKAPFSLVYELFYKDKFFEGHKLSWQTVNTTKNAFANSKALHNKIYSELRTDDFQAVVDALALGYSSKQALVNLLKQMGRFALAHDIVMKDYAQFVKINAVNDNEKGVPFTVKEIKKIFEYNDTTAMILLYTGMRISELGTVKKEGEHFVRGGVKTKAGKDRLIPIHPVIQGLPIKKVVGINTYRKTFAERYPGHTPHDLRHTATWLMQSMGCDDLATRMILGHSLTNDIEKNTYGHRTPEQLYDEICKIPDFRKKNTTIRAVSF